MRPLTRWQTAALAVTLSVAVLAAVLIIAEHHVRGLVLRTLSTRMGREVRVEGTFEAHLLARHPAIMATRVVIGNPPWMPAGTLATIGRVNVQLEWQLATPLLGIRRLELGKAHLRLVRDAGDHANWYKTREGPGEGPPLMRSVSVPDAKVELHDDRLHMEFTGAVSVFDAAAAGGEPPPLRIEGRGLLNGREASFAIDGDPLSSARPGHPYHFTLEEHSGAARLIAHGFLRHALDFRKLEGTFEVAGPDLMDLYFLTGLRLVHSGEFHLFGKVLREDTLRFIYKDLAGTSGKSDVSGTLSVDSTSGRIRMAGELSSGLLRLSDFGARAAGDAKDSTQKPASGLPDRPLQLTGLRNTDAKVRLRAEVLDLGRETVRSAQAAITTDRGKLSIEDLKASLADGMLSGAARLDASGETPRGALDVSVADVHLNELKGSNSSDAPLAGALSGRAQLDGQGKSWHELAANANGTLTVVLPRGAMRASLADTAGVDLSGALGFMRKSRADTGIRCGVASLDAQHGVFVVRTLVLDTDKVLITGSGTVHMDTESVDLTLRGRPKRPEIALHEAVAVRGTLAHPEVKLTGHGALAQAGAAVALGVVLTPLASLLAFVNPGLAHNADCAALLSEARGASDTP